MGNNECIYHNAGVAVGEDLVVISEGNSAKVQSMLTIESSLMNAST
jgi:hypothetical protein